MLPIITLCGIIKKKGEIVIGLFIGIDLGTSAMKLLLMDKNSVIHNIVTKEYPLEFPKPGWSQQSPEHWKKALLEGIPELLQGFDGTQVAGIDAGGLTGGFNFDAKNRRPSYTVEDMFHGYILGMDFFALGLLKAAQIIEDGRIDSFIAERYASYKSGIGAKIRSGEATLEELAAYAEEMGAPKLSGSGKQEYLEAVVNNILFFI